MELRFICRVQHFESLHVNRAEMPNVEKVKLWRLNNAMTSLAWSVTPLRSASRQVAYHRLSILISSLYVLISFNVKDERSILVSGYIDLAFVEHYGARDVSLPRKISL